MLCNALLERTTSKLASAKGSLRASPVCTSTLSATPSIIALLSVPAALLPLRSSCCHLSIPTARPVESRLAAPIRNNPRPHPTSSTRSSPPPGNLVELFFALTYLVDLAVVNHPQAH